MNSAPVAVDFHPLAAAEYRRARGRYARVSGTVAARFVTAVDAALQRITAFPAIGAAVFGRYRQVRVTRFPYTLNYRIVNPLLIRVVAIAHTSRRPGYWIRRTP